MRYLVNSAQMKRADQYTIQEIGIPSLELMERAAGACVDVMAADGLDLSRPCVVCGSGNNGGDGFAVARLLMGRGIRPVVCFVGNESHCSKETRVQMRKLLENGGRICNEYREDEYSIIIDAVFGVGLSREITGGYREVIERMNASRGVKFAIDMPSGISADTGGVLGIAFQADLTVTFQAEKLGLVLYPGKEYAGKVLTADIGIDMEGAAQGTMAGREAVMPAKTEEYSKAGIAYTCSPCGYQAMLPIRRADSNKGSYGKLLVIAGSKGMSGAAFLNGSAAYLSGAGLVRIYTHEENRVILQQQLPEAIITTYMDYDREDLGRMLEWADTVCIGSGLGMGESSVRLVEQVIREARVPCLVDADGLNILAEHREWLSDREPDAGHTGTLVMTPHMKEMSRLTGRSVEELRERRMEIVKEFADRTGCTCVLKDARTVTASPSNRRVTEAGIHVNLSGNAAMAKAGSGDVLAGIISAFLAQGLDGHRAACLGTYLHGRAGDHARALRGSYSVLARDLLLCISGAFKELEEYRREEV